MPLLGVLTLALPPTLQQLLQLIELIRSRFDDFSDQEQALDRRSMLVAAFGSVAFSIGLATRLLCSRLLLAAALSSVTLWRPSDPIPMLLGDRDENDDEDGDDTPEPDDEKLMGSRSFRRSAGRHVLDLLMTRGCTW